MSLGIGYTPRVQISIEGIRDQVVHSFLLHNGELEKEIASYIEEAFNGLDIKGIVKRQVAAAVDDAIRNYFLNGEGRKAIDIAVNKMFIKDII